MLPLWFGSGFGRSFVSFWRSRVPVNAGWGCSLHQTRFWIFKWLGKYSAGGWRVLGACRLLRLGEKHLISLLLLLLDVYTGWFVCVSENTLQTTNTPDKSRISWCQMTRKEKKFCWEKHGFLIQVRQKIKFILKHTAKWTGNFFVCLL